MPELDNAAVAERLEAFAGLLDLAGSSGYTSRAYRRAAETIRGTPAPILDTLSKAVLASLAKPAIAEQILKLGFTLKVRDPAAFRPYHQQEIATWEKIIKDAGVKPE